MALIEFKDLPNTTTPLTADNLNNNFNFCVPLGGIVQYAGEVAPNGWLICDGSAVSRETYSDLYAVIGTTYGVGDGSTTFNLPNLKGRVPVGLDSSQTEFDTLGETGGEKTHTLTIDEMPNHRHNTNYGTQVAQDGRGLAFSNVEGYISYDPTGTGGDQPHNILQPYIVLNYIIKY